MGMESVEIGTSIKMCMEIGLISYYVVTVFAGFR
jgi:hypothetical protein